MTPIEHLEEQIRDIILLNGGDISIDDHPSIIREAADLGISRHDLSRLVRKVYDSIEWPPYHRIDKKLEEYFLKGSIGEFEAEAIVDVASNELPRPKVINYIVANLRRREFRTRERKLPEADSFKNHWMTDSAWAIYQRDMIAVEWLGEKAYDLGSLGEISYRKPVDAKYYLRNGNILVPAVLTITKSSFAADQFARVIEQEGNIDKRYLNILYRLNPRLPFDLDGKAFKNIESLFAETGKDPKLLTAAFSSFNNGFLQIWVKQTDPVNGPKVPSGLDFNSFLTFVYQVDPHHPFYLNGTRFDKPADLFQLAWKDASTWKNIAVAVNKGDLFTWFNEIGLSDDVVAAKEYKENTKGYTLWTEEDKDLALVQFLMSLNFPNEPDPKIVSDQPEIKLLSIEGSKPVNHPIHLQLSNTGFAMAVYTFEKDLPGITLSHVISRFWSQNNQVQDVLTLSIDPSLLLRNTTYNVALMVDTEFETLTIPVEIRLVFPKRAYLLHLAKYAAIGALFFAIVRFITGEMVGNQSWFHRNYYDLPDNYFGYFIGLVLLLGGLIGSVFLIRKLEKI